MAGLKKLYRKLTKEQIDRGIVFSSCLSPCKSETSETLTHEVFKSDEDKDEIIKRLKDDRFFKESHFKFNIIRTL